MLFGTVLLLLNSCGIKRYLEPHQVLLKENKVEIEKPYRKEIASNITKYYRQKPNRPFMGIFKTRPFFYLRGSRGKKDNWWKRLQRNTLGEAPVIFDTTLASNTMKSFQMYLRGEGYYYPTIDYTVDTNKRQKATVTYHIQLGKQYVFGEYHIQAADRKIDSIVGRSMRLTYIKTGQGFHHDIMKKEQDRVVDLLRNRGYYGMSSEFVDFDVDTTAPDGFVRIGLNIRNENDTTAHKQYYVKSISVDVDKSLNTDQTAMDTFNLNGTHYDMRAYKLNPNVLDRTIQFETGELYMQNKLNRTYSKLNDLGIFRFINIQTKVSEKKDSGFVDYQIRMIPAVKYSLTPEIQAITSDQSNNFSAQSFRNYGIAFLAQLSNRNVFRNAEILQLSLRSSFEAQGGVNTKGLFNATEQSITASIIMPRILWFPRFDKVAGLNSVRTVLSASALYEVNFDYNRRVFSAGMNYQFNKRLINYYFAPMEISFIRSEILNDQLQKQSENDIFLKNTFSNNLILNNRFGLSYSTKPVSKGLSYIDLRWDALELSGNILTLINNLLGSQKNSDGTYELLGVQYFQYAKSAIDFRYTTVFDKNNTTVFRLFSGMALPYGNTPNYVPFERRFFIGGVNSLRAWRPRDIGPGSYSDSAQLDFSGEIKLEANAEFRFNIYRKWFEGAIFTDAGNVWAIKADPKRPGANFTASDFYKSLAWDAGIGTRFNFEIIVLRLDFAFPLHDPTKVLGERWQAKNVGSGRWLLNNTTINFGIGYPF